MLTKIPIYDIIYKVYEYYIGWVFFMLTEKEMMKILFIADTQDLEDDIPYCIKENRTYDNYFQDYLDIYKKLQEKWNGSERDFNHYLLKEKNFFIEEICKKIEDKKLDEIENNSGIHIGFMLLNNGLYNALNRYIDQGGTLESNYQDTVNLPEKIKKNFVEKYGSAKGFGHFLCSNIEFNEHVSMNNFTVIKCLKEKGVNFNDFKSIKGKNIIDFIPNFSEVSSNYVNYMLKEAFKYPDLLELGKESSILSTIVNNIDSKKISLLKLLKDNEFDLNKLSSDHFKQMPLNVLLSRYNNFNNDSDFLKAAQIMIDNNCSLFDYNPHTFSLNITGLPSDVKKEVISELVKDFQNSFKDKDLINQFSFIEILFSRNNLYESLMEGYKDVLLDNKNNVTKLSNYFCDYFSSVDINIRNRFLMDIDEFLTLEDYKKFNKMINKKLDTNDWDFLDNSLAPLLSHIERKLMEIELSSVSVKENIKKVKRI